MVAEIEIGEEYWFCGKVVRVTAIELSANGAQTVKYDLGKWTGAQYTPATEFQRSAIVAIRPGW